VTRIQQPSVGRKWGYYSVLPKPGRGRVFLYLMEVSPRKTEVQLGGKKVKRRKFFVLLLVVVMVLNMTGMALAGVTVDIISPADGGVFAAGQEVTINADVYDSVYGQVYSGITWLYLGEDNNQLDTYTGGPQLDITLMSPQSFKQDQVIKAVYQDVYEAEINITTYADWVDLAIGRSLGYLTDLQQSDGSFAYSGWDGSLGVDDQVAYALAASGVDLVNLSNGGDTYLDYLAGFDFSDTQKLITAINILNALGMDASDFNGQNLAADLKGRQQSSGEFDGAKSTADNAQAVIAVVEAGEAVTYPQAAESYFKNLDRDGGLWTASYTGYDGNEVVYQDIDTSAMILRAFNALSVDSGDTIAQETIAAFNGKQDDSGAIADMYGANYDSTAQVVLTLSKLGINPTMGIWQKAEGNLVTALLKNQNPATGAFKSMGVEAYTTWDTLLALANVDKVGPVMTQAESYLTDLQQSDGSFAYSGWDGSLGVDDQVAYALAASGVDLVNLSNGGDTYLDYLAGFDFSDTQKLITAINILNALGMDASDFNGQNLAADLKGRQQSSGEFDGAKSTADNAQAVIAVVEAGEAVTYPQAAESYFKNLDRDGGLWTASYTGYDGNEVVYQDIDTSAMILRAFNALSVDSGDTIAQETIAAFNGKQDDSGAIADMYGANYDSTAQVVLTLSKLGINPTMGIWQKAEGNLVTALLKNQNPATGAFKSMGVEAYTTWDTLLALASFTEEYPTQVHYGRVMPALSGIITNSPDDPEPPSNSDDNTISVNIEVQDISPVVEDQLQLPAGSTVMDALMGLGLDVETGFGGSYVSSIEGVEETISGTGGWKYSVNGYVPANVGAGSWTIEDEDEIIWFFAENSTDDNPGRQFDDIIQPEISEQLQEVREAIRQEAKEKLAQLVGKPGSALVLGESDAMTQDEIEYWQQLLEDNEVDVDGMVETDEDTIISDDNEEVNLALPAGALAERTSLTVREQANFDDEDSVNRLTSVYNFGPDGTVFKKPVQLRLKTVFDGNNARQVRLAWYDEENNKWQPVPTVVDVANGEVTGLVNHFTKFAVIKEKSGRFEDFSQEKYPWAYEAVEELAAKGVLNGVGEGLFAPNKAVTRAEFIKMLVGALEIETDETADIVFEDVEAGSWYAPFVGAAFRQELVTGYEDNSFKPNAVLNRQEMTAMVVRAVELSVDETVTADALEFADKTKVQTWAAPAVNAAVDTGLVNGVGNGRFAPLGTATRAQAAVIIWRAVNNIE